jgi:hypothetical protein
MLFFIQFLQNYLHYYIPRVFFVCFRLHFASVIRIIALSGGPTPIRIIEDLLYSFVLEAEDSLCRAGKEASCVHSATATVSCDAEM